jgi:Restriction endonuclease
MLQSATLRGYLLEEVLAWLLRGSGYRLLVDESQDHAELKNGPSGLCVKGRGAEHQVDVLGEFAFTPAFSLPIRLFLEAKFRRDKCDLRVVRNAHGIIHDINENFLRGPDDRLRKRYRYVYAVFSTSGFTDEAQDFALAQQISLVDLSGASFTWLRRSIGAAAADLDTFQHRYQVRRFPIRWMRGRLQELLGTAPEPPGDEEYREAVGRQYRETDARLFSQAAMPVLDRLHDELSERQQNELLLGFPAAPFILPLATDDVGLFLRYAREHGDHPIRLRRTGEGREAEWAVTPADQEPPGSLFGRPGGYRLTFNLPERLESWISEHEEHRTSRLRAIKEQFLSDIVVYRMDDDILQTFQLQYQPGDLRRNRHRS